MLPLAHVQLILRENGIQTRLKKTDFKTGGSILPFPTIHSFIRPNPDILLDITLAVVNPTI